MRAQEVPSILGIVLLGVIQGVTEFLPVSSSGHLVIGQVVVRLAPASLLLDVLLHVGTLLPVLWLYRVEIVQMAVAAGALVARRVGWSDDASLRLLLCVAVGSVPTALIGLWLQDLFEQLFSNTMAVGVAFIVTGAILMLTRQLRQRRTVAQGAESWRTLTFGRALLVGVAQGAAITPGISRSGTTIAAGLLLGVERETAARFSFLLSVPAILGATLLQLRALDETGGQLLQFAAGALGGAISGYIALRWVVSLVRRGELHWFAYYLWPLGASVLLYTLLSS